MVTHLNTMISYYTIQPFAFCKIFKCLQIWQASPNPLMPLIDVANVRHFYWENDIFGIYDHPDLLILPSIYECHHQGRKLSSFTVPLSLSEISQVLANAFVYSSCVPSSQLRQSNLQFINTKSFSQQMNLSAHKYAIIQKIMFCTFMLRKERRKKNVKPLCTYPHIVSNIR